MAKHRIDRRTLLRGIVGSALVAVGLPTLEIMLDSHGEAFADGAGLPVRFMTWFFGNGIWPAQWIPSAEGQGWPASPLTKPLFDRGVNPYCSILTGFQNRAPETLTHHEGMIAFSGHPFVTCADKICSDQGGPTVDQVIASVIGGLTAIPSFHVGVSNGKSYMDGGTTMFALSHKGTKQPQYPNTNPVDVYKKIFGSFTPPNDIDGPLRIAALDAVRGDVASLEKRLGAEDKKRLDAHLDSLSAIESKINAVQPVCEKPRAPTETNPPLGQGDNEPLVTVNEIMAELVAFAFACDITRVMSYMFTYGAGSHVFRGLGHDVEHHAFMSHDEQYVQNGQFQEGVVFEIDAFAYLLQKLMNTPDVTGGNLLDNSIIYMSSDSSWNHDIFDMPLIVAGKGRGALTHPGIHYRSPNGENISDILLTMAQVFDPTRKSIGSGAPASTTPLQIIRAAS
jgi:hypothetical protein